MKKGTMLKRLVFILILPVLAFAQLIDPDVMPFGAYSSRHATNESFFTSGRLDTMHNILGFNQHMCGGFTPARTDTFVNHGIYPYPWNTWSDQSDPQMMYSHTHYVITHPESDSSQYYKTKFTTANGYDTTLIDASGDTCGYRYYGDDGTMLSGLGLSLHNKHSWFLEQFEFYPIFKLGIDSTWTDTNDVVGVFSIVRHPDTSITDDTLRFVDTIFVYNLPHSSEFRDTVLALANDYDSSNTNEENYFTVLDGSEDKGGWMKFKFETAGNCTVFVDYFKIFDQYGTRLIDSAFYDAAIIDSTSRPAYENKILGWFLKDTQNSSNYRPFGYINNLIEEAMDSAGWSNRAYGASWDNLGSLNYFRECMRLSHPKIFWTYIYPFDLETEYTGSTGDDGLQYDLNHWLVRVCDSVKAVLADYDSTTEGWLYTPQAWYCDSTSTDCRNREQRRMPTRSEMRCLTFMGMCYHPLSILFWKYDTYSSSNNHGIVDENGNLRPGFGYAIRDDINPYIKAIDSVYLDLTWDNAYAVNPEAPFPSSDLIDTI
ncbi:MAG: hypothetical protein DRP26_07110, partial [Candidatus Zixiibacteriota bacterium]